MSTGRDMETFLCVCEQRGGHAVSWSTHSCVDTEHSSDGLIIGNGGLTRVQKHTAPTPTPPSTRQSSVADSTTVRLSIYSRVSAMSTHRPLLSAPCSEWPVVATFSKSVARRNHRFGGRGTSSGDGETTVRMAPGGGGPAGGFI